MSKRQRPSHYVPHRQRGGWKKAPMSMSDRGALGNLASRGKRAPMDQILITTKPTAPATSWWQDAPREGWQAMCEREEARMRGSKFASTNAVRRLEDVA